MASLARDIACTLYRPSHDTLTKIEVGENATAEENGRVTTNFMAAKKGVTTLAASTVLKGLANRALLTWHGKSPRDPQQYYEITTKNISE